MPNLEISKEESKWKNYLSENTFRSFSFSRGYLRLSLSKLFNIPPLEVPLIAKPGMKPFLTNNYGHISISHCKDALICAWAPLNIGIDIEITDRDFSAKEISNKYFHAKEKESLRDIDKYFFQKEVLKYWIIKEAAYKWQSLKKKADFFHWEWIKDSNIAINKNKDLEVRTYLVQFEKYFIGIAYN